MGTVVGERPAATSHHGIWNVGAGRCDILFAAGRESGNSAGHLLAAPELSKEDQKMKKIYIIIKL